MIRPATLEDVPAIVQMAQAFTAQTSYQGLITMAPAKIEALTHRLIERDDALVLVAVQGHEPVGMLAMHLFEHPMSGDLVAQELVWWMEATARGSGRQLLTLAEQWAHDMGAAVVQMVSPTDRVGHFYERLGYTRVETLYQRRLV